MILYASQRGRSAELAAHLLNGDQNDHVTVHEIRGFVSQDVAGALREAYAMSRGTRCKQFLFSVSLNPPEDADVPIEVFEGAIEDIERKLNLIDQPRIVVFHEKNGRRHCHVVWSRIDTDKLKAVHMSHFKMKLMDVSHALFLKHGWKLPKGMQKGQKKSRLAFTREEYRQAVRLLEDPEALKAMFLESWERSDSKATFARALEETGFYLAKGDRRGYVVVDLKGGIYSLTRWLDIGTRDLKARLGKPEDLPDIGQAKAYLASRMTGALDSFIKEARQQAKEQRLPLVQEVRAMTIQHRQERADLIQRQDERWIKETRARSQRFPRGFKGIWHKATGAYKQVRLLNEKETTESLQRDRQELHSLVRSQLKERQELQTSLKAYKEEQRQEIRRIRQDIARYVTTATEPLLPKVITSKEVPLTTQLAQLEAKIGLLTGDLTQLQASLESNLLSDEVRSRIRALIEKAMAAVQLKAIESQTQQEKTEAKEKEYRQRQAEINEYIRQYAELQHRIEQEQLRHEANKAILSLIVNMTYALNGIPRWQVTVMEPPPQYRLNEKEFIHRVQRQTGNELLKAVFKSPSNESQASKRPPINPPTAVPALRQNVLEVKEMLVRAGLQPRGDQTATKVPKVPQKTTSKFNAIRR